MSFFVDCFGGLLSFALGVGDCFAGAGVGCVTATATATRGGFGFAFGLTAAMCTVRGFRAGFAFGAAFGFGPLAFGPACAGRDGFTFGPGFTLGVFGPPGRATAAGRAARDLPGAVLTLEGPVTTAGMARLVNNATFGAGGPTLFVLDPAGPFTMRFGHFTEGLAGNRLAEVRGTGNLSSTPSTTGPEMVTIAASARRAQNVRVPRRRLADLPVAARIVLRVRPGVR